MKSVRVRLTFVFATVLASQLSFSSFAAGRVTDFCGMTASDMLRSCQTGVQSDYVLATAKCDNVADSAAKNACQRQAGADRRDAQETCQDQFDARDEACDRFGPAAYDPAINPANFVAAIDNPYFPLTPGTTLVYEGQTAEGAVHVDFAITRRTRLIQGVRCVEVHDSVYVDGVLAEDTLDWFAQDKDGNVWYFGENTHEIADGLITTIDGSFLSGIDRAKAGIIMKAHPMVGDYYRQEFDLGNAEDNAETTSINSAVTVPAGSFDRCVRSRETTPLETSLQEDKYYAPGIGNVLTVDANNGDRIELVAVTHQ